MNKYVSQKPIHNLKYNLEGEGGNVNIFRAQGKVKKIVKKLWRKFEQYPIIS